MALDVKFLKGETSGYQAIKAKEDTTFYYTTDEKDLYIGEQKLTSAKDVAAAVARITKNEGEIATIKSQIENIGDDETEISALQTAMEALQAVLGESGENFTQLKTYVGTFDLAGHKEVTDVIGYIDYQDGEIKKLVTANTNAITTLNGEKETEGSVKYIAAQAVAEIVAGADAKYDTLKEIADWIKSDVDGAAKMQSDIATNTAAISAINNETTGILAKAKEYANGLAGNYETKGAAKAVQGDTTSTVKSVEDKVTAVETKVNGYETRIAAVETALTWGSF